VPGSASKPPSQPTLGNRERPFVKGAASLSLSYALDDRLRPAAVGCELRLGAPPPQGISRVEHRGRAASGSNRAAFLLATIRTDYPHDMVEIECAKHLATRHQLIGNRKLLECHRSSDGPPPIQ
jgi:hypothetical protein